MIVVDSIDVWVEFIEDFRPAELLILTACKFSGAQERNIEKIFTSGFLIIFYLP
jgi:hypothetical protein